ncbi:magnesium chelatase [Halobiforma lacisalsi AJ5]|uniref:Magnesium chelatase n=1 Tax=Natronobacterium lacisalsi AJ5 TaxID=358396 RepID=M0LT56_NATLA|nr:VWA domain-containing protein [Halobiforma lacisalsi]APW99649.1 magnesium chelatase [Halobiforma lacisalsi AJ5]EMA35564.1 protporphyrin IX magnesium chelatase [Halobiforma lacisalsi AJ5]
MVANAGDKKLSSLPFPAIVGQRELKRVLLAVAVNDDLDGALIAGEKGTAKSTAVRGLADLLPDQRAVADCPYGCDPEDPALQCADCRDRDPDELPVETRPVPLVTLPLGATRDRVVGTLSVEDALAGEADFDPGLLARAHRGILYVDEVNLLEDHLVDVLLDAAATGVNTVERDGMSVSHPAEFTLIGTMNPEEGDLRPQLRDRFALRAAVEGCRDVADRVEVMDRVLEDGSDDDAGDGDGGEPSTGTAFADDVATLRTDLREARERLPEVSLPREFKEEIARLCLDAGVDGHRGDVAIARTATTLAALEGHTTVIESDVREAARYALPHRLRSDPFEEPPDLEELLEERFDEPREEGDPEDDGDGEERSDREDESTADRDGSDGDDGADSPGSVDDDGTEADDGSADRSGRSGDGDPNGNEKGEGGGEGEPAPTTLEDRSGSSDPTDSSRETDSSGDGPETDGNENATPIVPGQRRAEIGDAAAPDLESADLEDSPDAAAAGAGDRGSATPSANNRGARVRTERASASGDGPVDAAASVRAAASRGDSSVRERDLRRSVRAGDAAATIVFAVDASASMRPAMRAAKGVVLELLRDSYRQRDRVAFVTFAGDDAEVLLPPTDSVSLAARHLKELPTGDRTPLPAGLETSRRVLERAETEASVVVLVTDGRANVADGSPTAATRRAARGLADSGARVLVVDAGGEDRRADLTDVIAEETGGRLVDLSALSPAVIRTEANAASESD